ncbi:LCP family protein [Streptosporangium sp. NPDC000396]|uniref:LCP family protein n=1 Tax=Streptosporangium sp. NPDC000396 TaxID=3366185 RepID=UPI0036B90E41
MDDLTMLRDLGRDLEHEPPATLVRQRQRLLDASARPRPRLRLPRPRGWMALGLAAAATAAIAVIPAVLLNGRSTVPSPPGDRPAKQDKALNVLVVGTDSQVGTPRFRSAGARSDMMILLHLPVDRKNVKVISIPRDSMVRIPACESPAGKTVPAHVGMINSAFFEGGLACAWKTVEAETGVRVDHAMEIEFSGFKGMVNALGGVEVTLPKAVYDPKSKLRLAAGRHVVNGEVALAYVRTRHSLGDGSDLGRIKLQQQFMSAMAKKAMKSLTDPARLSSFLGEATKWIKTDAGLDLSTMYAVARSVEKTAPDAVVFATVPVRPFAADLNRLEWDRPAADRLFASIKGDAG